MTQTDSTISRGQFKKTDLSQKLNQIKQLFKGFIETSLKAIMYWSISCVNVYNLYMKPMKFNLRLKKANQQILPKKRRILFISISFKIATVKNINKLIFMYYSVTMSKQRSCTNWLKFKMVKIYNRSMSDTQGFQTRIAFSILGFRDSQINPGIWLY